MRSGGMIALGFVCLAACSSSSSKPPPASGAKDAGAPPPRAIDAGATSTVPTLSSLASVATHPDTIAEMAKAGGPQAATLAWDLFLYLDWPATPGQRGVPDPKQSLGATPVVWQTWKEVHETYLAGGLAPPPWNDGGPQGPPTVSLTMIDGKTLNDVNGNPVTYTILLNQGVFDYITSRSLYGWAGQAALRQAGAQPVAFPTSGMEVKASWKILDPVADKDRMSHYLVAQVLMPAQSGGAPTKLTVGLTGLHIISKALPSYVWITFEQIENPTTTGVTAALPMDPVVAKVNAQFQQALTGLPYAWYQLDGVQTEYTTGGKPTLLANTQIETYFQTSSSCISCHARASISTGSSARLQLFKLDAGNLVGYTGAPDQSVFGPGKNQYSALDFVWSMREAKQ